MTGLKSMSKKVRAAINVYNLNNDTHYDLLINDSGELGPTPVLKKGELKIKEQANRSHNDNSTYT